MSLPPYEFLKDKIKSQIEVHTHNNKIYRGSFENIDDLSNVHLNEAIEITDKTNDPIYLGTTLINGGNVSFFNIIE